MNLLDEYRGNCVFYVIRDLSLGSSWEHVISAGSINEVEAVASSDLNLSCYSIETYWIPVAPVELI